MKLSILIDGEWHELGDCEVMQQVDEIVIPIQPLSVSIDIDKNVAKAIIDAWYSAELKAAGRMN